MNWSLCSLGFLFSVGPLLGCAAEFHEESEPDGDARSRVEAATGSNPIVDTTHIRAMFPVAPSEQFVDLAVSASAIFVLQTNSLIYQLSANGLTTVETYTTTPAIKRIDYVMGAGTNVQLIGTSDATRKVYRRLDNFGSGILMGDYPFGVTLVEEVAGHPVGGTGPDVDIYIRYQSGGFPRLRHGRWTSTSGIAWDATVWDTGPYFDGLCVGPHPTVPSVPVLFMTLDFTANRFHWYSTLNLGTHGYEASFPFTDHAYTDPGGWNDRFAPAGLDYRPSEDMFYGIDRKVAPNGVKGWALAKLERGKLMP